METGKSHFLAEIQNYSYYPCSIDLLGDFETPLSLFHKLQAHFLLESVEKLSTVGRYSFIGVEKREQVSLKANQIHYDSCHFAEEREAFAWEKKNAANGEARLSLMPQERHSFKKYCEKPLDLVRKHYLSATLAPLKGVHLPFIGGLIGYMGFEAVRYFETLPLAKDVLQVPDVVMVFPRFFVIYDNSSRNVKVVYFVASPFFSRPLFEKAEKTLDLGIDSAKKLEKKDITKKKLETILLLEAEKRYDFASEKLSELRKKIQRRLYFQPNNDGQAAQMAKNSFAGKKSNFTKESFMKTVEKCKEYIKSGDVFQIVASQRFSFPISIDPFEVYRSLRMMNPSPYLFYLRVDDFFLVGSSPEMMVRVHGDELSLRPIAGTRARGVNEKHDEQLRKELLASEKELAEHLMLVDLGRNDIGRFAEIGSVRVSEYMQVEKYSHVQHIVSLVQGEKRKDVDVFDIIAATFPAGTLCGAPKLRAIELIMELEKEQRGPYGGMVFCLSFDGYFDSCITIRTLLIKEGMAYLQAGAGVVYDSLPDGEYLETINKAKVLFAAVEDAGERISSF